MTRPRDVQFLTTGVPPPSAIYVTQEVGLLVESFSNTGSVQVNITVRMLLPNGTIVPMRFLHVTDGTRALLQDRFSLAEGFLLSVTADTFSTAVRRGGVYLNVSLQRGSIAAGVTEQVLISNYVDGRSRLLWPGGAMSSSVDGAGMINALTGANPAAGAEISETVPTGAKWSLLYFRFTLVTSATVATRRVHLQLRHSTGTALVDIPASATQTASLTQQYSFAAGLVSVAAADSENPNPLPELARLTQGQQIVTVTTNLQAGDDFGAPIYQVEEWMSP